VNARNNPLASALQFTRLKLSNPRAIARNRRIQAISISTIPENASVSIMKTGTFLSTLAVSLSLAAFAFAGQPSDASLKELIGLMQSQKMVERMMSQMQSSMESAIKQSLAGHELSDKEKAAIDKLKANMTTVLKEELSWDKMEPVYLQVYRETFTQEEIDGAIAFYKTPAGQAFISKMPTAMSKSMSLMQQRMAPIMEKLRAMQADVAKELKQ
jgi:hypothetical protein